MSTEPWSGAERRKDMQHFIMLPECLQVFKRIEDKIDVLVKYDEKMNGKYEEHIKDSVYYRNRVERHDEKMKVLTFLFGILTVPVVFLLIKVVMK